MLRRNTKKTNAVARMNADLGLGNLLNLCPFLVYIETIFLKRALARARKKARK
jgi:hypothetical protein